MQKKKEKRTKHYGPEEVFIIKVQDPIYSSDMGSRKCLVYDEHRIIQSQLEMDDELEALMKGRSKAFFYATISAEGLLNIDTETSGEPPWQEW
jgi:hypothetical protein